MKEDLTYAADPAGDRSNAVCVVGAGPAGLAMARALRARGIDYDQVERNADVGGLWDIDSDGSPMYETAHFISSRTLSGFENFPMPDDYPDYPSHRRVLAYLRSFAAHYGLRDGIQFGVSVEKAEQDADGLWSVSLSDGTVAVYRAIIVCSGAQWYPNMPDVPAGFSGEALHSSAYRSNDIAAGKRVMVVGGGNSACDIAVDVSHTAETTIISIRRGYWFIPKHLFGIPSDLFAENGPTLPKWFEQRVFGWVLRRLYGKPERLGLQRPDHRLFETHPVLNSSLFHSLQHGDVVARPDIRAAEGTRVEFVDGRRDDVDMIIYATGYKHRAPYVQSYLGSEQHPDLYLTCFSRDYKNLFGVSFTESNTGAYLQFDMSARMIASYLEDQDRRPEHARQFEALIKNDHPDLSGGIHFDGSARHKGYVDGHTIIRYRQRLCARMGWPFRDAAPAEPQRLTAMGAIQDRSDTN